MKPETVEAFARAVADYIEGDDDDWQLFRGDALKLLAALTTTPEYQALVKDAERYRMLRANPHLAQEPYDTPWETPEEIDAKCDAAIDAARAGHE